jgi:hypothetical protein
MWMPTASASCAEEVMTPRLRMPPAMVVVPPPGAPIWMPVVATSSNRPKAETLPRRIRPKALAPVPKVPMVMSLPASPIYSAGAPPNTVIEPVPSVMSGMPSPSLSVAGGVSVVVPAGGAPR